MTQSFRKKAAFCAFVMVYLAALFGCRAYVEAENNSKRFLQALTRGDYAAARELMDQRLAREITPQRFRSQAREIATRFGRFLDINSRSFSYKSRNSRKSCRMRLGLNFSKQTARGEFVFVEQDGVWLLIKYRINPVD